MDNKNGDPIEGVIVTLVLGGREIAKTTTGPDGKYSFETKVAPGIYNLVAEKDGVTMTVKVTVVNKDVTVGTITMPEGKTNSVVEAKSDDPSKNVEAEVGNLDQIFKADEGKAAYTTEDKGVVDGGGSVEIKLTVTKTDAAAANEIKKQLTGSAERGPEAPSPQDAQSQPAPTGRQETIPAAL